MAAACGARHARPAGSIQTLWSGYGEVRRYTLEGGAVPSVVVKCVAPPARSSHPRGWDTDRSHQRKLRSYQVERAWYEDYAPRCEPSCRVPRMLASFEIGEGWFCVMEDLDAAGFDLRPVDASASQVRACLCWLANFHATFMSRAPRGLWEVGTYWHLATRPDELKAMGDEPLRAAAGAIDEALNRASYQTLVHGDAKLANFCLSANGGVAAVDFQYVGAGAGIKDVMYFLSSCLDGHELERDADDLLDHYFGALRPALSSLPVDPAAVERQWRALYPVAWADFVRFLRGWSPDHRKLHEYSERLTRRVLQSL